jgi:D-3-phosphoglycerate dehydrogenase
VDVIPEGYKLLLPHDDRPGMIGQVGSLLGAHDINIAGMQVGRDKPRGQALMVLSIDNLVPEAVIADIMKIAGIKGCVQVQL